MINKYKELHDQLMAKLIEYHKVYTAWSFRRSKEKTKDMRNALSDMRRIETEMRAVAQEIMREDSERKRKQWNRE